MQIVCAFIALCRYQIYSGLDTVIIDGLVDVMLLCDIILNFRTSFVKQDGTLETEPKLVSAWWRAG